MSFALVKLVSDEYKDISFTPIRLDLFRRLNQEKTHYCDDYKFTTTLDRVDGSLDVVGLKFNLLIGGDEYGEIRISSYGLDMTTMEVVVLIQTSIEHVL